ncbi:hypothetical protein PAPYR_11355 [Paratrimastix pyriformis]|uniref:Uncharacterized protein n=1 Tax=Paratrimastix pyriformis TaxID=342808 RepID=A0ABQ8U8W3_9EUKA|nr:hypothetical protein PAPYR_11355 [Paratrimastix pyriformis]
MRLEHPLLRHGRNRMLMAAYPHLNTPTGRRVNIDGPRGILEQGATAEMHKKLEQIREAFPRSISDNGSTEPNARECMWTLGSLSSSCLSQIPAWSAFGFHSLHSIVFYLPCPNGLSLDLLLKQLESESPCEVIARLEGELAEVREDLKDFVSEKVFFEKKAAALEETLNSVRQEKDSLQSAYQNAQLELTESRQRRAALGDQLHQSEQQRGLLESRCNATARELSGLQQALEEERAAAAERQRQAVGETEVCDMTPRHSHHTQD